jgi:hypothetical protein
MNLPFMQLTQLIRALQVRLIDDVAGKYHVRPLTLHMEMPDNDEHELLTILQLTIEHVELLTEDDGSLVLRIPDRSRTHSVQMSELVGRLVGRDWPIRPETILQLGYLHESAIRPFLLNTRTFVPSPVNADQSTTILKFLIDAKEENLDDLIGVLESVPPMGIKLRLLIGNDDPKYRRDALSRLKIIQVSVDTLICIGDKTSTHQCDKLDILKTVPGRPTNPHALLRIVHLHSIHRHQYGHFFPFNKHTTFAKVHEEISFL